MVTVDGWLAVVALQIGAAGLHEMVVGIGEVAGPLEVSRVLEQCGQGGEA